MRSGDGHDAADNLSTLNVRVRRHGFAKRESAVDPHGRTSFPGAVA